jgi:hypothetical protein
MWVRSGSDECICNAIHGSKVRRIVIGTAVNMISTELAGNQENIPLWT